MTWTKPLRIGFAHGNSPLSRYVHVSCNKESGLYLGDVDWGIKNSEKSVGRFLQDSLSDFMSGNEIK